MNPAKRINRNFNHWTKKRSEEHPPNDTHLSIERDRGTVKAEAITNLEIIEDPKTKTRRIVRTSDMPTPPRRYNGSFRW